MLTGSSVITTLLNSIRDNEKITVFGCDLDAKLTLLKESGKSIFFVSSDIKEAVSIKEKLSESGYRVAMLMDKLDFKLSPFQCEYNKSVIDVLCKVLTGQLDAVIVNPMFLHYLLPKKQWIESRLFNVYKGQTLDIEDLKAKLINMGFERCDVPNQNQFNVKGDMVDVCLNDIALRIYFDFDEVASIKTYDKESLLNLNEIDEYSIFPTSWFEDMSLKAFEKVEDSDLLNQLEHIIQS